MTKPARPSRCVLSGSNYLQSVRGKKQTQNSSRSKKLVFFCFLYIWNQLMVSCLSQIIFYLKVSATKHTSGFTSSAATLRFTPFCPLIGFCSILTLQSHINLHFLTTCKSEAIFVLWLIRAFAPLEHTFHLWDCSYFIYQWGHLLFWSSFPILKAWSEAQPYQFPTSAKITPSWLSARDLSTQSFHRSTVKNFQIKAEMH